MGMPKTDFWIPFVPAWSKSLTVATIQSGFHKQEYFQLTEMLSKFLTLAQVVQQTIWQTFITDKARIVFQNDVHFIINCFLYCRLFVLIVQFHFAN